MKISAIRSLLFFSTDLLSLFISQEMYWNSEKAFKIDSNFSLNKFSIFSSIIFYSVCTLHCAMESRKVSFWHLYKIFCCLRMVWRFEWKFHLISQYYTDCDAIINWNSFHVTSFHFTVADSMNTKEGSKEKKKKKLWTFFEEEYKKRKKQAI